MGTLPCLGSGEWTVERDQWGVRTSAQRLWKIFGSTGYVMAQDRLWQMDLLRRAARERLSEIWDPER
jgi:acyl-homoserine lactone acylase PvdQ